jgi:hypothetical protein
LRDGSGNVLGSGSLGKETGKDYATCTWTIIFNKVPANREFYTFEVARRGEIRASRDELKSRGWKFEGSIS